LKPYLVLPSVNFSGVGFKNKHKFIYPPSTIFGGEGLGDPDKIIIILATETA